MLGAKEFGERLQISVGQYVEAKGIKQSHVVRRTGYPQTKVSKLLNGKQDMTLPEFFIVCDALDHDPVDFILALRGEDENEK